MIVLETIKQSYFSILFKSSEIHDNIVFSNKDSFFYKSTPHRDLDHSKFQGQVKKESG